MVKSLARIDVEMIEPEIDHHLLELARIFYGPEQPGLGRLLDDYARALARRLEFFGPGFLARTQRTVVDEQLERVHPQRIKLLKLRLCVPRYSDRFGMELFLKVLLDADLPHVFQISGPRPERQSIEQVKRSEDWSDLSGLPL